MIKEGVFREVSRPQPVYLRYRNRVALRTGSGDGHVGGGGGGGGESEGSSAHRHVGEGGAGVPYVSGRSETANAGPLADAPKIRAARGCSASRTPSLTVRRVLPA